MPNAVDCPDPTPPPSRIRFDGTITLGNIMTAVGVIVPLLVWGVRLEDRVSNEVVMRERLETKVDAGIADVARRIDRDATDSASRATDIKADLRAITQQINALLLQGQQRKP